MPKKPREHENAVRRARYSRAKSAGATSKEASARSGHALESESERLDEFKQWSSRNGQFPARYLQQIETYNRQHRKTKHDHLGYRAFYWFYVYGLDDKAIRKNLRDNDS